MKPEHAEARAIGAHAIAGAVARAASLRAVGTAPVGAAAAVATPRVVPSADPVRSAQLRRDATGDRTRSHDGCDASAKLARWARPTCLAFARTVGADTVRAARALAPAHATVVAGPAGAAEAAAVVACPTRQLASSRGSDCAAVGGAQLFGARGAAVTRPAGANATQYHVMPAVAMLAAGASAWADGCRARAASPARLAQWM